MATTVNEVISFIWSGQCTGADRQRIIQALNGQRKVASTQAATQFVRGDRVQFTNKYGSRVTGVIDKVNRMTINVTADGGGRWRVSPTFLQRITSPKPGA